MGKNFVFLQSEKLKYMKKLILSLILLCINLAVFANDSVEVMVLMKARYDRTELCRRAELYRTKAERRDYVVKELKALHLSENISAFLKRRLQPMLQIFPVIQSPRILRR